MKMNFVIRFFEKKIVNNRFIALYVIVCNNDFEQISLFYISLYLTLYR